MLFLQKKSGMRLAKTKASSFVSFLFSLLIGALVLSSCSPKRHITYFEDTLDKQTAKIDLATFEDPRIRPNDILQISVQTLDPTTSNIIGAATTSSYTVQSAPAGGAIPGYLVDKNGIVEFPLVGKITVGGMTTSEAREAIRSKASLYYKDPVVNIRFANFGITVIGEVTRPAQYIVPNEKVNILDALGMAGDLTVYGKRENVLLIRDEDGKKTFVRFNLNSSNIFQSPYFFLRQGDLVYVEPNKNKMATTDAAKTRTYSVIISAVGVLIAILTRVKF